jgi:alcohol dehydrogenase (nicotinoprotein)
VRIGDDIPFTVGRWPISRSGGSNPIYEMPSLLNLYRSGHLKLDEIITARYSLEQINDASRDLLAGENIRGVIIHDN